MVWVVFDVRLPAARVPGRDRLTQARRLVVVAAAAVVVDAAGARTAAPAELDRPAAAFFLAGRALHLHVLHRPEARPADGLLMVRLREVGLVHAVPWTPPCRTAEA